jgi:hypothetical protein
VKANIMKKNEVWIRTPDRIHNNYGLEIWCEDTDKVQKFVEIFSEHFPIELYWPFFQGGYDVSNTDWAYFEFWKEIKGIMQDDLLERAEWIAKEVNLPLNIK